ncbi:MAG: hypothetical protein ACK4NF_06450, partial [Planctomycetota bacterium]
MIKRCVAAVYLWARNFRLATDLGLELFARGKVEGETFNVAGVELVHRPTLYALKDALMFLGAPPYDDKFINLPSDMTIDEVSIRILDINRYIIGSGGKAQIANQIMEAE